MIVSNQITLDDHRVARLRQAAERLHQPQSQVVRDAVRDYADRVGRLSEHERLRMLSALDAIVKREPTRSTADVDRELREIRAARRGGGRQYR